MKTIHLIRHAKSSWDDVLLSDIERPLNHRGINSCMIMASHIHEAGCDFTHVFCSPAVRAQSTIELIADSLVEMNINWQVEEELYTFDSNNLLHWCQSLDDSLSEIVIVAHNPALTDFCNELSDADIQNIPTCGYVQLSSASCYEWWGLVDMRFELSVFLTPKGMMTI